jgi:hypothetical protein
MYVCGNIALFQQRRNVNTGGSSGGVRGVAVTVGEGTVVAVEVGGRLRVAVGVGSAVGYAICVGRLVLVATGKAAAASPEQEVARNANSRKKILAAHLCLC